MADLHESAFDAVFDQVVTRAIGASEVPGAEVDLLDAGLDSFALIKLLMELEDELGVYWPVEHLSCHTRVSRVGELRSTAREKLFHQRGARPERIQAALLRGEPERR